VVLMSGTAIAGAAQTGAPSWWEPGDHRPLPAFTRYANERGEVAVLNTSGSVDTTGHPSRSAPMAGLRNVSPAG